MGNRHIENVARNIIGKLCITYNELIFAPNGDWAEMLYERRYRDILREVLLMNPETLGKIVAQGLSGSDKRTRPQPQPSGVTNPGKTSMYDVHLGVYLGGDASGREILTDLATTALIAEMTDILRETAHRDAERMEDTSEGM